MRSQHEQTNNLEASNNRELRLLSELESASEITQRDLSKRLGIALGLTNVLLRNLAQKGYIRATHAGWKRWLYNLTPEGFSHKLRLTVSYVHRVLGHYQTIRQTLREQLDLLPLNAESRIALYGTGEFAELVYLGLKDIGIEEIDVFDLKTSAANRFLGMPVRNLDTLRQDQYDRVVLAVLDGSAPTGKELEERGVTAEKLVMFFTDHWRGEAA